MEMETKRRDFIFVEDVNKKFTYQLLRILESLTNKIFLMLVQEKTIQF